MKTRILTIFLALSIVFGAGNAMAIGFGAQGFVNPDYMNSWDPTTGTGTAQFSFYITNDSAIAGGVSVNQLSLIFDEEIFVGLGATDFTVTNPATGWSSAIESVSGGLIFSLSSTSTDPVTTTNDPLVVNVAYTLSDADAYSNTSGATWTWHEGGPWELAFAMNETVTIPKWGTFIQHQGIGSTAPVPEPGTMILLGSGLVGLAFYGRRCKKA